MPHVKQCCFQPAESPVTSPSWVPIKNQPMLATMDTNNFVSGLSGSMWIHCTFSLVCHKTFFTLKSTSSQGQVMLPNWSLYGSGILLVTIRGTHKQNTAFAIQSIYTRLRMGTVAVSISQLGGPKDEKTPGIRDVDCRFY